MQRLAALAVVFLAACGGNDSRTVEVRNWPSVSLTSPQSGGEFGHAVAFVGDLVAVGAPDQNRVYLYRASDGSLVRTLRGEGRFGAALAANGNELFVGAPREGSVEVYDAIRGERLSTLRSGTGGEFGAAVATSGSEVWVGAPARHAGAGEVVRFAWPSGVRIGAVASPHAVPGGGFGSSLAESAGLFAAGAPGEGRVYHLQGGVIVDTLKGGNGFGSSVALGNGLTLVGSPVEGRAYVYGAGAAPRVLEAGVSRFGLAVALDGTHAVVAGAAADHGQALVFDAFTGALQQNVQLGASPGGATLATKDGIALVGLFQLSGGGAGLAGIFNCFTGDVIAEFLPPNAVAAGTFGHAVAFVDSLVAVSQPLDGTGTEVFLFGPGGNLVRTLTHASGWGEALADRDGDLVIGAPQDDVGQTSNAGAVHIVDVLTGSVTLTIPNPEPEAGGGFGGAIVAVGNDLLIGAPGNGGGEGRAYLVNGTTGAVVHTLASPQSNTSFGEAVAAEGSALFVGAPREDTSQEISRGLVHEFDATTGEFLRTYESPDFDDGENAFGAALAAIGGELWVGAPAADIVPPLVQQSFLSRAGRVYVFEDGEIVKSIQSTAPQTDGEFGFSLAAASNRVAIGAPGEAVVGQLQGTSQEGVAYLYERVLKFHMRRYRSLNPETFGRYGAALDLEGEGLLLLAGAPEETVQNLSNAGRAYLQEAFTFTSLASPQAQDNGNFGETLAVVDAVRVLVGAQRENNNDGAAYLITPVTGNVVPLSDPAGPGAGNLFGRSLAVVGGNLLVGATNAVHVFDFGGGFVRTINAPNAGDFGAALARYDLTTFLVAAPNDGNGTVYRVNLLGNVVQTFVSDATGIGFGTQVVEVAGRVCVSAPTDPGTGGLTGAVHVFDAGTGTRLRKIFALDPALTGQFGLRLAEYEEALLASVPLGVSVETVWLIDVATGGELLELTHPDGIAAGFGRGLAQAGDLIAVGASAGDGNAGEVFLFDDLGQLVARVTSPNPKDGGLFGFHLVGDASGNLVIGAHEEDINPTSAGRAYAFLFVPQGGGGGAAEVTLESPNPEQDGQYGKALAFSGSVLQVGAPGENGSRGRVYAISGAPGAEGTVLRTLNSPNAVAGGEFGATLAANPSFLAIGAPNENVPGVNAAGRAYLVHPTTGQLLLTFQSTNPQTDGEFGGSVAVAAANVAVGASGETVNGLASAGRAYYFDCVVDTPLVVLRSPSPVADGDFGYAVATVDTTVYVGAPGENNGAGRVYRFNGLTGQLVRTYQAPDGGRFGERLLLMRNGDLLVGAPLASSGQVQNAGRAYRINPATGVVLASFDSDNPQSGGGFGLALAANNDSIGIGAPLENQGEGVVYLFLLADNSFDEFLVSPNPEPGGNFGSSVVGFGDTGAVGAPFETAADVSGSGRVYVNPENVEAQ